MQNLNLDYFFHISSYSSRLTFIWFVPYENTLNKSFLRVTLENLTDDRKLYDGYRSTIIQEEKYDFILDKFDNFVWKGGLRNKKFFNKELSEIWIRELLELAFKNKSDRV